MVDEKSNDDYMEGSFDSTEKSGWSLKRPATPSQAIPIPLSKTRHGKLEASSLPTQFGTPERTEPEPYYSTTHNSHFLPLSSLFFTPPEDEHVTVWEPLTGKTVAGNAAPYRKNLKTWLESHPGWEEKADEFKSSKRRSLLRRQKQIQAAFSNLLANGELALVLKASAEKVLTMVRSGLEADSQEKLGEGETKANGSNLGLMQQDNSFSSSHPKRTTDWSLEETTRLQEALVYLGEEFMLVRDCTNLENVEKWKNLTGYVFYKTIRTERNLCGSEEEVYVKDVLENTIKLLESGFHSRKNSSAEAIYSSPLISSLSTSPKVEDTPPPSNENFFQMPSLFLSPPSFTGTAHREPRITVWDPKTGRTISGNAAPCARNLESWMALHPGWIPKSEEYLSSARRGRHRRGKSRTSISGEVAASAPAYLSTRVPSNEDNSYGNSNHLSTSLQLAESPAFSDALDGLLLMQICNRSSSNQTSLHANRSTDNPSSSSVSSGSQEKLWDKTQDTGMEYIDMELEEHNP
ncbi:hypothetical protein Gasu2_31960 [Galdieria sulphuraria]|uniref:BRK domain-containing protein n=1 Tax=Galdieria sulphuraria TaxID=130081 RepID=M2WZB2_GALSU|nr:uncharacterized protein Gasu_32360 [Galdieria sulphuraria]EME29415.1 hypothetical protein Gasu_32360 [Galdieria sulphuraria]GJD08918.1 hypothetical protein Gasu2_31960 [Galdieria sulphuraria]|eukprot:XP_005705935.1 hypothetical protein Gasu_32360 [Galdieria sulphuraria]